MKAQVFIISLGGSLVVPEEIDFKFLKRFKDLIEKEIKRGKKFIIIVGGGKTARKYQQVAKKLTQVSNEDLDWLGIHATRINAHLLLTIFRKNSYYRIIKNPKEKVNFKEKILIAAGWKPGFSTDYDAVLLAKTYKSNTIINLTNINYVYNKDPNKFENVKPLKKIRWKDYLRLIDGKWFPGMSAPFDPLASKLAYKLKLNVIILNGKHLQNLEIYLSKKIIKGTLIF
ncbi:MAG: uridylate kinase [Candidatus Parcubacteria bacterium]|nr:MAG: uridylate kinase [Candidatus Parcubacteria bacterium]